MVSEPVLGLLCLWPPPSDRPGLRHRFPFWPPLWSSSCVVLFLFVWPSSWSGSFRFDLDLRRPPASSSSLAGNRPHHTPPDSRLLCARIGSAPSSFAVGSAGRDSPLRPRLIPDLRWPPTAPERQRLSPRSPASCRLAQLPRCPRPRWSSFTVNSFTVSACPRSTPGAADQSHLVALAPSI
jgi:hypothetical protein